MARLIPAATQPPGTQFHRLWGRPGLLSPVGFLWAMVPDVVEYDRLETGEHRGEYTTGVWGFASKLTAAFGIALTGWVLQLSGYVPNVEQTEQALLGIRLFFGPVPLLVLAIALPLLLRYPITRQSHARVLEELAAMEAGESDLLST